MVFTTNSPRVAKENEHHTFPYLYSDTRTESTRNEKSFALSIDNGETYKTVSNSHSRPTPIKDKVMLGDHTVLVCSTLVGNVASKSAGNVLPGGSANAPAAPQRIIWGNYYSLNPEHKKTESSGYPAIMSPCVRVERSSANPVEVGTSIGVTPSYYQHTTLSQQFNSTSLGDRSESKVSMVPKQLASCGRKYAITTFSHIHSEKGDFYQLSDHQKKVLEKKHCCVLVEHNNSYSPQSLISGIIEARCPPERVKGNILKSSSFSSVRTEQQTSNLYGRGSNPLKNI